MKLDQLTYFLEAAKHESVGKAARVLAISPSAISHSIAVLEEELGHELFVREKKRIFLSGRGKLLMERASKILRDVESLKDDLASEHAELHGSFRILGTPSLATRYLVIAWCAVQKRHPRLALELHTARSTEVVRQIARGEMDFGLAFDPPPHSELHAHPLGQEEFVVAVRKGHPLLKSDKRQRVARLSETPASAPLAFRGIESFETLPILKKLGITQHVNFVYDSYEVGIEQVARTESWSLMPRPFVEKKKDRIATLELPGWDAKMVITALWPRKRGLARGLRPILEELERSFPND